MVIVAAARVGGILANSTYPYEFIQENLGIELNVIHEAYRSGVKRLIFLGSSCIYPRLAPQPLKEEYLLTGPLEETNRPYAVAKIAGIELCRSLNREYGTDYLSLMPTNMYGPGDNFDLETSHLVPALIRKFHEGKTAGAPVVLWGTGTPKRELMHVDDLARAVCLFIESGGWGERPRCPGQHRHRQGPHHRRTGRDSAQGGGLRGRSHMGRRQARRHPAEAARREPGALPGLGGADQPGGRPAADLRLVRDATVP